MAEAPGRPVALVAPGLLGEASEESPPVADGVVELDSPGDDAGPAKKRKGKTTRWNIPKHALQTLEQVFKDDKFPSVETRKNLAAELRVTPRQVQVWFQNKRQRSGAKPVPARSEDKAEPNFLSTSEDIKAALMNFGSGAQVGPTRRQHDVMLDDSKAPSASTLGSASGGPSTSSEMWAAAAAHAAAATAAQLSTGGSGAFGIGNQWGWGLSNFPPLPLPPAGSWGLLGSGGEGGGAASAADTRDGGATGAFMASLPPSLAQWLALSQGAAAAGNAGAVSSGAQGTAGGGAAGGAADAGGASGSSGAGAPASDSSSREGKQPDGDGGGAVDTSLPPGLSAALSQLGDAAKGMAKPPPATPPAAMGNNSQVVQALRSDFLRQAVAAEAARGGGSGPQPLVSEAVLAAAAATAAANGSSGTLQPGAGDGISLPALTQQWQQMVSMQSAAWVSAEPTVAAHPIAPQQSQTQKRRRAGSGSSPEAAQPAARAGSGDAADLLSRPSRSSSPTAASDQPFVGVKLSRSGVSGSLDELKLEKRSSEGDDSAAGSASRPASRATAAPASPRSEQLQHVAQVTNQITNQIRQQQLQMQMLHLHHQKQQQLLQAHIQQQQRLAQQATSTEQQALMQRLVSEARASQLSQSAQQRDDGAESFGGGSLNELVAEPDLMEEIINSLFTEEGGAHSSSSGRTSPLTSILTGGGSRSSASANEEGGGSGAAARASRPPGEGEAASSPSAAAALPEVGPTGPPAPPTRSAPLSPAADREPRPGEGCRTSDVEMPEAGHSRGSAPPRP
ncbi:hypothetical protein EMIHUDRAFT_468007 [Emiliania huxleyi CCMP1516]|uniref:Homeobox domain-containing protein n=3 Tax=Emiliania huxleyi TaxID=2903 RepID=A0A0D3K9S6_EMIH1|nr:hypothetical protein EMIHUDRAFT_468007 [Emiliania huxleyi CCMP1516]EOD32511.1 hypothetical protein EMIHUDRAFT_468007 [Emiliania huxleyi CCMP1516]|eukprot:XP_005784940.1 hypothetical protein EMIHUDRAFT_468007 [Emiliania huxleyi CCMP1516]